MSRENVASFVLGLSYVAQFFLQIVVLLEYVQNSPTKYIRDAFYRCPSSQLIHEFPAVTECRRSIIFNI